MERVYEDVGEGSVVAYRRSSVVSISNESSRSVPQPHARCVAGTEAGPANNQSHLEPGFIVHEQHMGLPILDMRRPVLVRNAADAQLATCSEQDAGVLFASRPGGEDLVLVPVPIMVDECHRCERVRELRMSAIHDQGNFKKQLVDQSWLGKTGQTGQVAFLREGGMMVAAGEITTKPRAGLQGEAGPYNADLLVSSQVTGFASLS